MPSHVCVAPDGAIWSFGWQRSLIKGDMEEENDYPQVRRFSRDGQQTGAFLPRSQFSPSMKPFPAYGGLWMARAAKDRVGSFAHRSQAGHREEWVELDLEGNLIGRWPLPARPGGGFAFTLSGDVYIVTPRTADRARELLRLNRDAGAWDVMSEYPAARGLLLGAEGDDLVFTAPPTPGFRLQWFRAPAR